MSAQPLPFLSFTAEDIKSLSPINSQCTVLCEIEKIWAKEAKNGGTNIFFRYICIDDNSPEKGKPAVRSFPLGYPTMFAPILCAALRIEASEIQPGPINLAELIGKTLFVKFDLRDNGQGEFTIQPVDYFRADRPI